MQAEKTRGARHRSLARPESGPPLAPRRAAALPERLAIAFLFLLGLLAPMGMAEGLAWVGELLYLLLLHQPYVLTALATCALVSALRRELIQSWGLERRSVPRIRPARSRWGKKGLRDSGSFEVDAAPLVLQLRRRRALTAAEVQLHTVSLSYLVLVPYAAFSAAAGLTVPVGIQLFTLGPAPVLLVVYATLLAARAWTSRDPAARWEFAYHQDDGLHRLPDGRIRLRLEANSR